MLNTTGSEATLWTVFVGFGGVIIGAVLTALTNYFLLRKSLAATKALHDADRRDGAMRGSW
jgi:uncharacterized membrane protein YdjX (TVP38/TMEM64 family)